MKRRDCAYCIDLDEQGVLCEHPLRMYCGEPVEARCSSRCADYERRISITEAFLRIHDLEAKLAESEKYRAGYADMLIPLKAENEKLRELCADMWRDMPKTEACGWDSSANTCTGYDECHGECTFWYRMHDLGIEVDDD